MTLAELTNRLANELGPIIDGLETAKRVTDGDDLHSGDREALRDGLEAARRMWAVLQLARAEEGPT